MKFEEMFEITPNLTFKNFYIVAQDISDSLPDSFFVGKPSGREGMLRFLLNKFQEESLFLRLDAQAIRDVWDASNHVFDDFLEILDWLHRVGKPHFALDVVRDLKQGVLDLKLINDTGLFNVRERYDSHSAEYKNERGPYEQSKIMVLAQIIS